MRVLYGVVGEGMGHAIRSRVVLDHLTALGHDIEVMASGRAHDFLEQRFAGVNKISGLRLIHKENRVRYHRTLWANLLSGTIGVPKNIAAYFSLIERFKPDVVISDFDSWTYYYAKAHNLPVICVDNMHIIHRCEHEPDILEGAKAQFEMTKALVKSKMPFCDHYLITSFFHPPVRKSKERTTLYPPLLRPEVLEAKTSVGDHVLVYSTGEGFDSLLSVLKQNECRFRVYGMKRGDNVVVEGNLEFCPFSEDGFIEDLATSRAVIASAGFTLMGEAVCLGKPMLALPLAGQFEQLMNARYLEKLGFGMNVEPERTLDRPILDEFLSKTEEYRGALAGFTHDHNRSLLSAIECFVNTQSADSLG